MLSPLGPDFTSNTPSNDFFGPQLPQSDPAISEFRPAVTPMDEWLASTRTLAFTPVQDLHNTPLASPANTHIPTPAKSVSPATASSSVTAAANLGCQALASPVTTGQAKDCIPTSANRSFMISLEHNALATALCAQIFGIAPEAVLARVQAAKDGPRVHSYRVPGGVETLTSTTSFLYPRPVAEVATPTPVNGLTASSMQQLQAALTRIVASRASIGACVVPGGSIGQASGAVPALHPSLVAAVAHLKAPSLSEVPMVFASLMPLFATFLPAAAVPVTLTGVVVASQGRGKDLNASVVTPEGNDKDSLTPVPPGSYPGYQFPTPPYFAAFQTPDGTPVAHGSGLQTQATPLVSHWSDTR